MVRCLGLSTVFALACGCNHGAAKPPPALPAQVIVNQAVQDNITDFEDFTGRLEAFQKVDIQARVTGYLKKVNFIDGGKVYQGQVLFEIDPEPYQADLDKAEAVVVQAQARFKRLEGDLLRAQDLRKTISREEYEKIIGDHAEAQAAVGVAKAGRTLAQIVLNCTKVYAPFDGVASRSYLDPRNLIKADSTIMTTVVTQNPIYAYFDVDERTLLALGRLVDEGKILATDKSKVPVHMALADEEGFPHEGTVDFQDNVVDSNTGTKRLRGIFTNPKSIFAPGMFVRIHFQVGLPRVVILVPEQGVQTDQGQKFVYVVNAQDEVEYRKIKTGALVKNLRVVESGVEKGERIIVKGLQRVRPMAKVEPLLEPIAPAPAHEAPKAIIKTKDAAP